VDGVKPQDDASLTASERAALAGLEAKATAEDPLLARRLSGSSRPLVVAHLRRISKWCDRAWSGLAFVLIGLTLVVLSLSTVWPLGVVGLLFTARGLGIVAAGVQRRRANPSTAGLT
jgi:Protein of unknown function (DUF3040)